LFNGNVATQTQQINLLDFGDLYGERSNNWDLTLRKNIRFSGKRLNFGVDIYNLFNSDAATTVQPDVHRVLRPSTGQWVSDDPATPQVETNTWGDITQLVNPRFMRFTVSLDF
jgi:hypothetical protein